MRKFVALMEGDSPQKTRTILATEDPELVESFTREVGRRLGIPVNQPHSNATSTGPLQNECRGDDG